MGDLEDASDFGKRVRVARAWAGYARREDFVDDLLEQWPDWPIKSVVKRIENGEKVPARGELETWAERLEEFAGVPQWFMLRGWDGAQEVSGDAALDELREAVARHEQFFAQIKLFNVDGDQLDLATAAEQRAEELSQNRALRSVPSEPKKRVRKK
jgi:hypothetical protein